RGIQYATEQGIAILTITSANKSTQLPKLTSNANAALNYPASYVSAIQALVGAGYTVTAPRSLIQYQNWKGGVWASEKNDTGAGTMAAGFTISGAYAGGYTVGTEQPVTYSTAAGGEGTGYVADTPELADSGTFTSAQGQGQTTYTVTGGDPVN